LSPPLVHKGEVRGGAFRPDGKVVATSAADGTVRLWEVPTGRSLLPPLFHDGWVRSVAFSPDGKTLVTGCDDGSARLWSADDGAPLGAVLQHRAPVNRVAFHPNGRIILTASSDGTGRLWTPPSPIVGNPTQVALWVQVLTGMELDAEGTGQVLTAEVWQQRRQRLQELGGPPVD
jgi:WD40 repeat protein